MSQASHWEKTLGRWVARIFSPPGKRGKLVVFCYHQVLEATDPLRPGEPTLEEFEADIDRIAAWFNVLSLPDAAKAMRNGTLPPRAACITFDDGYLNNHSLAAPALEARNLPATFFITSGAVEQGVMWNDLIIDAVAACDGLPDLAALREHAPEVSTTMSPQQMAQGIIDNIKYLPLDVRWETAEQFYKDNAGVELPRKMMQPAHVADLAARGFDVGAHTVSHPILAKLDSEGARQEIEESVRWVAGVIGKQPLSFAYPNGRPNVDFQAEHAGQARDAGCEVAVTTEWAVSAGRVDAYHIPRVGPWWRFGRNGLDGLMRIYVKSLLPS